MKELTIGKMRDLHTLTSCYGLTNGRTARYRPLYLLPRRPSFHRTFSDATANATLNQYLDAGSRGLEYFVNCHIVPKPLIYAANINSKPLVVTTLT